MKKRIILSISALLLILLVSGCAADLDNARMQGQENGNAGIGAAYDRGREDYPGQSYANGITGTQLSAADRLSENGGGIVLRSISTPLRQGETGSLSFQGKSDTRYTITAVYKNSDDVVTTTVVRQSGTDGIIDVDWNVGTDTVPGTYSVMISGGGEQLMTSYTVTG